MVVATTDYVFRGVSQTYGEPALQGAVNYRDSSGWFAGAWGSNVDPYPFGSTEAEINAYAGFGLSLNPEWTARGTYTRYVYAWKARPKSYDYDEFSMSLAFEDRWIATVSYEPDSARYSTLGYVHDRPAYSYEMAARWPLPERLAISAGVGYYDLTHLYGAGYWSGNAGLDYTHGRFEVQVVRFFSDGTVRRLFGDASADGSWVATAIFRF